MSLQPGGIIAWIIVGIIAGWITGHLMRGRGYGFLGDLVLGLIGAFIGGIILSFFVSGTTGLIGSIIVAVFGAVILVAVVRAISGRHRAI